MSDQFESYTLWGIHVYQRTDNGYLNVTNLAKALEKKEGKRRDIHDWLSNKRTQEDFQHLSSVTGIPVSALIQVHKGEPVSKQGTYIHPQMSIRCAIWLSSEFGFIVEQWLEDWYKHLATIQANKTNEAWCQLRLFSKQAHHDYLTEPVKAVWELAQIQGSTTPQNKFQLSYAKMVRQVFGFKNKDALPAPKLEQVIEAERCIGEIIRQGIVTGTHYKEIFQQAKAAVESYFAKLTV